MFAPLGHIPEDISVDFVFEDDFRTEMPNEPEPSSNGLNRGQFDIDLVHLDSFLRFSQALGSVSGFAFTRFAPFPQPVQAYQWVIP